MRALICLAVAGVILMGSAAEAEGELRGIWMHASQIKTRAEADQWVAKIERARLNAVFMLVWYWGGQAFYHTPLSPMGEGVDEGYDPLGYMTDQCHRRGIEMHAWFVNGAYGKSKPLHGLDKHPDWAVDTGTGGQLWYDFGKPEVRKFQSDLMIGCLRDYDIDGIHFDYIRYGPKVCLCDHCQKEFARRYGYERLTGPEAEAFPIVARVSANALLKPTTATVLAKFADGTPAITLNRLGKGEALLLNWHAEKAPPRPAVAVLRRALERWGAARDRVAVADTAANRQRYGTRHRDAGAAIFRSLGCTVRIVGDEGLAKLEPADTLVLSALYIIPEAAAKQIEAFVEAGGHAVFLDGPTPSAKDRSVQRILGMGPASRYFTATTVIEPVGESELVARLKRPFDAEKEKLREAKWAEFRKWGVTELVRDVYRRAKALKPKAQVTAAVFTPLASADNALQDWPRWVREGCIDYVIPMAYTTDNAKLADQLAEWKTVDASLERIVPGLSIYQRTPQGAVTRDIPLILKQHAMCREAGAHGNNYFSLHYLSEALIAAFRDGPHAKPAAAYRPPARGPATPAPSKEQAR